MAEIEKIVREPQKRSVAGYYYPDPSSEVSKNITISGVNLDLKDDKVMIKTLQALFALQTHRVKGYKENLNTELYVN